MKINRTPGRTVQIDSSSCPSSMYLLKNLPLTDDIMMYRVSVTISKMITIV